MGRLFLIEFDGAFPHYFMCNNCQTYIALPEDEVLLRRTQGNFRVFSKVVNVQVDKTAQHYKLGPHTVTDIYCVKCGYELGRKYIRVGGRQILLQKGYVRLMMENFWRRYGDQTVDAVTMRQVLPHNP